jgi:hypothetical protein
LTSFKVVLGGETRGLLVYAGVFCQRHRHQCSRGFSETLVELLDIALMSVRCSAGLTMSLRDLEKPRGLVCSGEPDEVKTRQRIP